MPVFLEIEEDDVTDPSFWAALVVDADSTIDVSDLDDDINVTLTANSIIFENTDTGVVTTYEDGDLAGGSFSAFVEFVGNDGNSNVSGATGLNADGYEGGDGDDIFVDDGNLGGRLDGGDGDDTLVGGVGSNNIDGGDGEDVLFAGAGGNNLSGGDGNDTLFAQDGAGLLDGGEGDDDIFAGLNTNFVQGGDGTDGLTLPAGSTFTPFFPGSTGGTAVLPNGTSFTYLNIENVVVTCFTAGTLIRTPTGDVPIERLEVGDQVSTLDRGPQPVRWMGVTVVDGRGAYAPIRFAPGSIGNVRPLFLSPQHRVLLSGWKCELLYGSPEVLCAAKQLCDGDRIAHAPRDRVTYFHMMFERHEIVWADGARLESFFVGDHIAAADMGPYAELLELFPELAAKGEAAMQMARPCLKSFEAQALI
ncbi:Hint domain-containing protein [Tateyamaria sp. syn59]|uniref:Hint domain-containing protein n=1 Tax=Tateyamaria sp. syn59 TaxID=2576942 RepID=UPI0011BE9F98|nr:Hint domain-containing protein [Tateyamaria sp. syn59]